MKKAMATIGISVMSIAVIASNASASEVVVVSAESLNMRSEPESDAYKVGRLLKGDKVTVIEKTEFWVKVKTDDGKTGWISSDYVKTSETEEIVEEEESNETAYVSNANGLNVRENSSMESGLLFTIAQNTKVNIIEENDNGWNKIKLENGSEGWVIATRLSKEKADVDKAEQISKEESDQNEKTDNDNKGDYATKEVNNSDSSDKTKEVSAFTGKVKVKSEKGLNVRKESTADSAIITTLSKGEVVKAIGKTGSWTKIKLDDGRKGWISSNGISTRNNSGKKVLNDKRKYAKNNTGDNKSVKKDNISLTVSRNNGVKLKVKVNGSLNVRSGPGTGNSIIGSLHNGDIVERIGISGSWIKIKMSGGRTGWVKSEYLVSPGTSGLTDSKPSEGGVKLKVKVNGSLNVRSGPGTGNSVIGSLHNGDIVKRIGVSGSWSKIKMSGGKTGWVKSEYLVSPGTSGSTNSKPSEGGVKLKVKVNGSLNVRSGPGTGNSVIGSLHNGDIVKRIGVSGSWSKIKMSGGKTGWVKSEYLVSPGTSDSKPSENGEKLKVKVNGSLNVRSGPGTGNSVIGSLHNGDIVERIGISGSWSKIKMSGGKTGWVNSRYITSDKENRGSMNGGSTSSRNIISIAKSKLGSKYRWGATGPNEFDCSGYTQWVFGQAGKSIPRISRDQARGGTAVSKSQMQPGDLVYFNTGRNGVVNHVGIYLGNNQFIHCSGTPRKPKYVMISSLGGFYGEVFMGARRY